MLMLSLANQTNFLLLSDLAQQIMNVWTVGFWAVGQLDRFFKEKNAPCRREWEGQTRRKRKVLCRNAGKAEGQR